VRVIAAALLLLHCALAQAQSVEWNRLNQRAWDERRVGKLEESVATARQMVDLAAREPVVVLTNSLNTLADFYRWQDKFALADPLYRQAISTWEKTGGPEHHLLGLYMNNLALNLV